MTSVRASDAEREEVARAVQSAGADGRLTMTETEERLAGVYAARYRHELTTFTEDLPKAQPKTPKWAEVSRRPLAIHGGLVAVLATIMIVRWVASGVEYFWPIFPLFWLAVSLVVHARIRAGRRWRYRNSSTV
jgi:hypothetical protein